jgi:hypothetical protein
LRWQEQSEQELQKKLSEERALWEASIPAITVSDSSLEDEVERAASKVFDRLEKEGVSFGIGEQSIEPMKELVQSLNGFGHRSEENTDSALIVNTTSSQNITTAKQSNRQPRPSARNVPFRAVRKAFSRATGIHGMLTPSTVQLRQRKQSQRIPKKKQQAKKQDEKDDSSSQKDDNMSELAVPQASTDAEVENQLWDDESENTGGTFTDVSNSGEDFYQQQDSAWNYEAEGGVELMSLMEPPPLPDFDDR